MRSILLAAALLTGCGGGASDRCDDQWRQMDEAIQKLGGGGVPGQREAFLGQCRVLLKKAPECLDNGSSDRCKEAKVAAQLEATPPVHRDLTWATASTYGDRATARVPVGWDHDNDFYNTRTIADGQATYALSADCDGDACPTHTGDEWAKIVDAKVTVDAKDKTIDKNENLAGGRVVVITDPRDERWHHVIDVFRWQDGGQLLFSCHAVLDLSFGANLGEVEDACRALTPKTYAN
jgi:hypothetical protein